MRFKVWMKAIRVPFFTATVIPVLFGYLLGWRDGSVFIWQRFLLTLFGALCIHAGTNVANDFFDHCTGCDEANPTPTPFSGGSRVIQESLITPKKMLAAALVFLSLGALVGLYLNHVSGGNVILVLGAIGIFLAFFYSAAPFKIGYWGFGELATGVGFGPLMVMGSYFVAAQRLSLREFLVSIPIGILIALVLFINEFPDYMGDKATKKRTLVVLLGKKRAVILYEALLALVYCFTLTLVIAGLLPYFCLIAFLSLPVAVKAFKVSKNNFEKIYELLPANAATIGAHAAVGALLCAGVVLDKIFRLWR